MLNSYFCPVCGRMYALPHPKTDAHFCLEHLDTPLLLLEANVSKNSALLAAGRKLALEATKLDKEVTEV
jgi:hypothetical protein